MRRKVVKILKVAKYVEFTKISNDLISKPWIKNTTYNILV